MGCEQFPTSGFPCSTIQLIEPDKTLPVGVIPQGSVDLTLIERGEMALVRDTALLTVNFQVPKSGDYRFEYLYIDALGVDALTTPNPQVIPIVPVTQSIYSFTVDLGAIPIEDGYVLRWRVEVLNSIITPPSLIDTPEKIRVQLTMDNLFTVYFTNPRSNLDYGFSELRVENLTDSPATQSPILPQVVNKQYGSFTVALSPTPPSTNYFLICRTP